MNIVYSGGRYQIYGDSLNTYDVLPTDTYNISFSEMMGFSLIKRDDLVIKEEKIYGDRYKKVLKTFNSFEITDRNLGVILSGDKGIGKTLFAKMIASEAIKRGYPVIMVDNYYGGIEGFISSIKQDVVVIFDEFDKTFCSKVDEDNDTGGPQEKLLGLFDGTDDGKKLFIITLNEFDRLSQYFKDRPGRFQYHFSISTPNYNEVNEYLNDKIIPEYTSVIDKLSQVAAAMGLNYDCLRAICFDINQGYSIDEVFEDINIDVARNNNYEVECTCGYGTLKGVCNFSLYDERFASGHFYNSKDGLTVYFTFDTSELEYEDGHFVIPNDAFEISGYRGKSPNGRVSYHMNTDEETELDYVKEMFNLLTPSKVVVRAVTNSSCVTKLSELLATK